MLCMEHHGLLSFKKNGLFIYGKYFSLPQKQLAAAKQLQYHGNSLQRSFNVRDFKNKYNVIYPGKDLQFQWSGLRMFL